MADELLSLRVIVVLRSVDDHDLFRHAAATLSVPVEVFAADTALDACRFLADGADLVLLDGALPDEEIGQIIALARATRDRPFTVLLVDPGDADPTFATDALATKPALLHEAKRLIGRAIRVRFPSRVLVVDDSATMRSIVRKILTATRFPFEFGEADEGFAALKLASQGNFDLAFLDYNMPEFSGLETLAEFKREKRSLDVVLMTSMQDESLAERAQAEGAAFLKKPFYAADIEAVLCGFYGLRALNPNRA